MQLITITGKQRVVNNNLKLAFNLGDTRAGSLARIGHEPPKLGVAGSNPVPPAIFCAREKP